MWTSAKRRSSMLFKAQVIPQRGGRTPINFAEGGSGIATKNICRGGGHGKGRGVMGREKRGGSLERE